ncbi:hypothetical protein [Yoonia sp. BS5-3]|uniref:Uncharacterized protein n=1 Tax=Yoonia phaeophyticola TaxID=3137369 RepID=A0ABZ2V467_9RHOB
MTWLKTDLAGLTQKGQDDWTRISQDVANDPPTTLLISNEMLFRPFPRAKLQEVDGIFDKVAQRKRLVAYLSAPDAMFLSSMQELLKEPQIPTRTSRTYFKDTLVPIAEHWTGDISLELFERQCMQESDIFTDFMAKHLPDVDVTQLDRHIGASNTSFSAEAMAVLYDLVMEHFPWYHDRRGFALEVMRFDRRLENPTKPKLRPHAKQAAINWRGPDLFWLRDTHGITFPSIDYDAIDVGDTDSNVNYVSRIEDICEVNMERKEELQRRAMRRGRLPFIMRRWLAKH